MLSDVLYILAFSLVVLYADFHLTKKGFNAKFNGLGCIPAVLDGKSLAPMQYRVLIPWICKIFGKGDRDFDYIKTYMWIRWFSVPFALGVAHLYFGNIACTGLLAMFFIGAALYDYTDGYLEVGFLATALLLMNLGGPWVFVLMLLCMVATLNRETAVVIPAIAFLGGDWIAGIAATIGFAAGYLLPRIVYPKVRRYCDLIQIRENLNDIKRFYRMKPFIYVEHTMFFTLVLIAIVVYVGSFPIYSSAEIGLGLLFLGLLVPTKWREIRVFAPCMLAILPLVVKQ